jgi:hypothetical protein
MEYGADFERVFLRRTVKVLESYTGLYEATLLLNCFVGLMIVPDEKLFDEIPLSPLAATPDWGLNATCIGSYGKPNGKKPQPESIRGVVHSIRNAVAHSNFSPVHDNGEVSAFHFWDQSGFDATVDLLELRAFVLSLAAHLLEDFADE